MADTMSDVYPTQIPCPLTRARQLVLPITRSANDIDAGRELPQALVDALAAAGFFRLLMPKSLGGEELPLPEYIEVVEVLAEADASTAWCFNQGGVLATNSAFLDKRVAREIWSTPHSVLANGPSPTAEAEKVSGGYRVTGRWSFSSGYRHATWLAGLAIITEKGKRLNTLQGTPLMRHMLFPKSEAVFIDQWEVQGLRGTGSHGFSVDDLFVPSERSVWSYGDELQENAPLYLYPTVLLFACGFASVAIGCARGALDSLLHFASEKAPRGSPHLLKDHPLVQTQIGEAEGTLRAARAYLHQTVGAIWETVIRAHKITLRERVELRLATTHAIRLAANTVDIAYNAWSSDAIHATSAVQRRFQDIHVITQHIQGRLAHYESVGRYFLGGEPDRLWL